jgi:hypothetical protein
MHARELRCDELKASSGSLSPKSPFCRTQALVATVRYRHGVHRETESPNDEILARPRSRDRALELPVMNKSALAFVLGLCSLICVVFVMLATAGFARADQGPELLVAKPAMKRSI